MGRRITRITAAHADVELGPGPVNFSVEGEDVKVTGKAGKGSLIPARGSLWRSLSRDPPPVTFCAKSSAD